MKLKNSILVLVLFVSPTLFAGSQNQDSTNKNQAPAMDQNSREESFRRSLENLSPEQREAMKKALEEREAEMKRNKR